MRAGRPTAAAIVLAAALTTSACASGSGADPHRSPPRATTTADPRFRTAAPSLAGWLMTRQAIAELSADSAARRRLTATPVDELLRTGQRQLADVPARIVVSFTSATALQNAIRTRMLPALTRAVLYDPEAWAFTPGDQQRHPIAAAQAAEAAAHADGLRLIVAPGLNLATVLAPTAPGSRAARFLSLRLAAAIARHADVVELQAQSLERDGRAYARFVTTAAAQARRSNPQVRVLAGLSTNPPGAAVTVAQLREDVTATRAAVQGYWLNVPGRGARCPTCRAADPAVATALVLDP